MFSTDNLFYLILFIVPGAIFLLFNRYLKPVPIAEKDETIRISGALVFSFAVFGINSLFFGKFYVEFSSQTTIFSNISLLMKIVLINVFVSLIASVVWAWFTKHVLSRLNNFINRIMKKPMTSRNSMLWLDIFEDKLLGGILSNCAVTVEKEGLFSTGIVKGFSSPTSSRIEILLEYVTDIEKYFKFDAKQTDDEKKYFTTKLYEYLDLTNGFKITFYDMTRYKELCKEEQGTEEVCS